MTTLRYTGSEPIRLYYLDDEPAWAPREARELSDTDAAIYLTARPHLFERVEHDAEESDHA